MIRNISLKLFLEGISVPIYGIIVSALSDMTHGASISIAATNEALRIRPRTHVLVSFFDPAISKDVVLFEGEVFGLSASRGAIGNSITLQCVDVSSYLASYRPYYVDDGFNPPEETTLLPSSTSSVVEAFTSNGGLLKESIQKVLGNIFTSNRGGLVDFFVEANNRLKLSNRLIGASGKFSVSGADLDAYLRDVILFGGHPSFAYLFNLTSSLIMHKIISTTTPSTALKTWAVVPDLFYAPAPMCNVVFPPQVINYDWSRSYLSQITRLKIRDIRSELADFFTGKIFLPAREQDTITKPDELEIPTLAQGSSRTKEDWKKITIEETERGPTPSEENLVTVPQSANKQYRKDLAEYMFRKLNIQDAPLTANILFNPYIVPGFPITLVDNRGFAFHGLLDSATHIIRKKEAVTTLKVSYTRQLEAFKKFTPPFVDTNWEFDNIANGYRTILPSNIQTIVERSDSDNPSDWLTFIEDVNTHTEALNEIFRPIISVDDLFSSLDNEANEEGTEYSGPTFISLAGTPDIAADILEPAGDKIPARQDIIKRYKESLR
jgi:hypothetical protein